MNNQILENNIKSSLISGDENRNILIGTINEDIIDGAGGNDTISGLGGDDSLDGGDGQNILYGGAGDDTLVNSFGYADGNSGDDILIADYSNYETAIQNIYYRHRIERIDNDVDLINLDGVENYNIIGTDFNDSFQINANDTLDGGEGIDKLSLNFSAETEPIVIDFTNTENQVTFADTQVSNFETIDSIYAGSNSDLIKLGLSASSSGGYIYGGSGDDTLVLDYSGYETAIQNIYYSSYVERVDNYDDLIDFSSIEQYQITGTQYDDSLQGSSKGDTLIGGAGNDYLVGNDGDDIILGVDATLENAGIGEIDTLVGGTGSDSFLLGNRDRAFYYDSKSKSLGIEDYALIKNFDLNEDVIGISGSKSDYRLGSSPITDITGTAIYKIKNSDDSRELIAIIEDVKGIDINSNLFRSVAISVDDKIVENIKEEPEPEPIPKSDPYQEAYQISRLSVGLEMNHSDFVGFESNFLADINQDGAISAFDAYLAYSGFDEF